MKLTDDQRQAIEHRGSSLLVSASAGSGKTEVLARRCVALVADTDKPCRVDQLLVVTFTRAAAAELRVRIARMLRERAEIERDAPLRRHLRRQEMLVDTADIGTIDAWCQRVVREHFDEAEIDPAFAILGEQEAGLLRIDVLDRVMRWVYTADDPTAAAARDWLGSEAKPSDGYMRSVISDLSRFRERLPDDEAWLAAQREYWARDAAALRADAEALLGEALAGECAFQQTQLAQIVEQVSDYSLKADLAAYADQLVDWATAVRSPGRLLETIAAIDGRKWPRTSGLSEADRAVLKEVREDWWKKRLVKLIDEREAELIFEHMDAQAARMRCLLGLEARYNDELWQAKRRRNALEFGDVLRMTVRLMQGDDASADGSPIARRLRERYEHILVDEFQDTSPLQVEMLERLTRRPPLPTNRFMVGDIKQSIYGFRDAEPRLFAAQVDRFESGREPGATVLLRDNFRSHRRLVDGINRLFEPLFDRELGGTDYGAREQLRACRDEPEGAPPEREPRIRVTMLDATPTEQRRRHTPRSGEPEDLVEREARIIAAAIRDLLAGGAQVPERTGDGVVRFRPARLGDVVILLRSAKVNAGQIARVLRREAVACAAAGRESILDSREVADVRAVLSLLANRRNDVAMAAYLRGPMTGLSAADLLAVRRAHPRGDYAVAAEMYADQRDDELGRALQAALAQLDAWRAMARDAELPVLIRRITREGNLALFARGLPGGAYRASVLEAFETMSAEFAEREQGGVAEFVEHLDALSEENIPEAKGVSTAEDVVRIMTIHAAKGLEFPFVFLASAGASMRRHTGDERLVCDEDAGIGMKALDVRLRAQLTSPAYPILKRRKSDNELEEELRLLYVAATRARERLHIIGHCKDKLWNELQSRYRGREGLPLISRLSAGCMLEWVLMSVAAGDADLAMADSPALVEVERVDPDALAQPDTTTADSPAPPALTLSPEDSQRLVEADAMITAEVDLTLARTPGAISVSSLKFGNATTPIPAPALRLPRFDETAATGGRDIGTATHRFLELADLSDIAAASDVHALAAAMVAEGRLSGNQAALLDAEAVAWFANTELARSMAKAGTVRREIPFVYALPDREPADRVILRGVIDCVIGRGDGLTILDYKTDHVDPTEATERVEAYSRQLQAYALAASSLFDRPVKRAVLAFLHPRKLVDVDVGRDALRDVVQHWREQRGIVFEDAVT